jgi:FtsH-binding integral membrane protein
VAAPRGVSYFNLLAIWGALGVFLALWITFYWPIWQAGTGGTQQHLSATAVYVASALGAVLGGFFGTAVGVQRRDPQADVNKLRPGSTIVKANAENPPAAAAFATAAFWVYAVVGGWSLLTVLLFQVQSPPEVKAMASGFAGIILALFTAALSPGQTREE